MTILIDAFNLIYKFPELEEHMYRGQLVEARRGLLERMVRVRSAWKRPLEIHLFFDGKKKSGDETRRETQGGMQIYFSCDLSADHLIKEFIKRSPNPGQLTVVSSDKDILFVARGHRCQLKTSEEFAAWVEGLLQPRTLPGPEKSEDPALAPEEVGDWLRMFRERRPDKRG